MAIEEGTKYPLFLSSSIVSFARSTGIFDVMSMSHHFLAGNFLLVLRCFQFLLGCCVIGVELFDLEVFLIFLVPCPG